MMNHRAILKLYPDAVTIVNGVAYDADNKMINIDQVEVDTLAKKLECKQRAKLLLAQSDWSAIPDVTLANKEEWVSYRANLRQLLANPVAEPVWPKEPKTVWSE